MRQKQESSHPTSACPAWHPPPSIGLIGAEAVIQSGEEEEVEEGGDGAGREGTVKRAAGEG